MKYSKYYLAAIFVTLYSTDSFSRDSTLRRVLKYTNKFFTINNILTKLIDYGRVDSGIPVHSIRKVFRETIPPAITTSNPAHTHPESAAWRSSCSTYGKIIASKLGIDPFMLQASCADVSGGFDYNRSYFWGKDTAVPSSLSIPKSTDLVIIVDVDYYLDISTVLLDHDGPVLLYTFQPEVSAFSDGEYSFKFDSNNIVTYDVSGGSSYSHQVWNYGKDVVSVSDWWTTRHYIVERRRANTNHEYVLLIPLGTWNGIYSIFVNRLGTSVLERLKISKDGFVVMDVQTREGMKRSIAKIGDYNCATIDIQTFDAIASCARNSKTAVANPTMQSWGCSKLEASVLTDYFRCMTISKPPMVYPAIEGIKKYQIVPTISDFTNDQQAYMVSYMSPIYPRSFVPDKSRNNEVAAVNGRILIPRSEVKTLMGNGPTPRWLLDAMVDFWNEVIRDDDQRIQEPVSIDEVYLRQARPSQRALLHQAETQEPDRIAKTFIKAEPYAKVSDPRIITTYNAVDKREYSRYIYAFSDYVKTSPWYTFGKTPLEIANAVTFICSNVTTGVSCTDANRMDGHISALVRDFERIGLMLFFKYEYHSDIADRHESQYQIDAKTTGGVKYTIEYERGSGSPETAFFNSILSKFNDYAARRRVGIDSVTAYNALGQFGGDDTIAAEITPGCIGGSIIAEVGALLGQSVAVDEFLVNSPGVNYLSRFYSNVVWYGDNTSFCDLKRTLIKLHVSSNMGGITPLEKLAQKISGLTRTDSNTPILNIFIEASRRVGLKMDGVYNRDCSWWSQFEIAVNWPNRPCCDESHLIETMLGDVDVVPLYKYLSECTKPTQLLSCPAICAVDITPVVKQITVIDEEIVVEPTITRPIIPDKSEAKYPTKSSKTKASTPTQDTDNICDRFINRECKYGSSCKFKHVKVCQHYLKGQCKSSVCKYPHYRPNTKH